MKPMNLERPHLKSALVLMMVVAGGSLFATPVAAHPGHSGHDSAPWYRYLPPGAPLPSAPVNR